MKTYFLKVRRDRLIGRLETQGESILSNLAELFLSDIEQFENFGGSECPFSDDSF